MNQRLLFRLPAPKRISATNYRLYLLDLLALEQPLPRNVSRPALRTLIKEKLVEVVSLGPARYRVTAVGRMVRTRPRIYKKEQNVMAKNRESPEQNGRQA